MSAVARLASFLGSRAAANHLTKTPVAGPVPFEVFEHTADIGVNVASATLDGLFADALAGLLEVIRGDATIQGTTRHPIEAAHRKLDRALVDLLDEVLVLQDSEELVFERAMDVQVHVGPDGYHASAVLLGAPFDRARHKGCLHVKAITFHELAASLPEGDEPARARILFDI